MVSAPRGRNALSAAKAALLFGGMREIVPLVCSNCGGPADPSLTRPCAYCGVPAPHDPDVRARLRRHAEHSRRTAAKLRTAALHQLHAAFARRKRKRTHVFHSILAALGVTALTFVVVLFLAVGGVKREERHEVRGMIALVGYGSCFGVLIVWGLVSALTPKKKSTREVASPAEIARFEEKLELSREARCGNCGARSSYVQVGLSESLTCPYCSAFLHAQCDAFETRVRQAVERALIDAHVEIALDDAGSSPDSDPSAPLMELAGFRNLGGIYEQRDAPCWVHSQHEQPWRCVVSSSTTLPGRLVLMTPDSESLLASEELKELALPEIRFSVRMGGKDLLGFADHEVTAHGVYSTDAMDGLAARLDRGEWVQLDGAGATALRLCDEGQLDGFARDFAGPLLAVVRSLSPRAA